MLRLRLAATALTVTVLIGMVVAGEAYLRSTERYANFWEMNGFRFEPSMVGEGTIVPWLWLFAPDARWTETKAEFAQSYSTTAEGLPEPGLPLEKRPGEYRIIFVGDSFTQGVGDLQGQGYIGYLRDSLGRRRPSGMVSLMNAGVSGSDPVFGLELIRRRLLRYRPDLVVMTINRSDFDEVVRRGGMARFTPDGQLKPRKQPVWASLYHRSHLVRAVVMQGLGYDWNLRSPREQPIQRAEAAREIVKACLEAQRLGQKEGFRFLVMMHPMHAELRKRAYDENIAPVLSGLKDAGVSHIDLMEPFLRELPDPLPMTYFWRRDGHFSSPGYQAFARAVEKALRGTVPRL
jgi:lysophospholipase L1-like esterase